MVQNIKDDSINVLADIISNLLGVLLVLIMLAALQIGVTDVRLYMTDREADTTPFRSPRRAKFPPLDIIYIVAKGRIAVWDLNDTVSQFISERSDIIDLPQGTSIIVNLDDSSDVDVYSLTLKIDWQSFVEHYPIFEHNKTTKFIADLSASVSRDRYAALFFVFPSGMELFSAIYPTLIDREFRFRWLAIDYQEPIKLYRDKDQFYARDFYFY